jgi:ADP-glucose pyrophosphorylase
MNTKDFIQKHKQKQVFDTVRFKPVTKNYKVAGMPIVECRDAIILNGQYKDIRLTDIFIFDSKYLIEYLLKNKYISDELKEIAGDVVRHQTQGMDNINTDIALGVNHEKGKERRSL